MSEQEPTPKETELKAKLEDALEDLEAHKEVHAHLKRVIMVKIHELMTEVLRLESAINDPKRVLGKT